MNKLKINFIIEYFYPEIGGLEKSTERLATELATRGHQVSVITRKVDETCDKVEFYKGFIIKRYDGNYIMEAYNENKYVDADVNCIFGIGHDKRIDIWEKIFNANKPTFIKIGTSGDICDKGFEKESFRGFSAILCQNDALVEEVKSLHIESLGAEKIKNGLNIDEWCRSLIGKEEAREMLNISKDEKVISAIGRYVARKNFPLIMSGCCEYVKKYKIDKFTLVLQGSDFGQHDGEETYIRELAKKYQENYNIIFVSPEKNVGDVLQASDIFITMGTKEGAPNIIIEALACGLPVIASDISGHDVYVRKDNGLLIDFSTSAICEAINSLFSDVNKLQKFSKVSKKISYEYDIKRTAELYLNVFMKYVDMKEFLPTINHVNSNKESLKL